MKEKSFIRKVRRWSKKIGVSPDNIFFKDMSKKWAFIKGKDIYFNPLLFSKDKNFQRAVIIHELIHMNVPNHGKLFKTLFLSYCPKNKL
ncbi:MAG: M48 family metallopeptidase [Elusimicrobiota bacterium]